MLKKLVLSVACCLFTTCGDDDQTSSTDDGHDEPNIERHGGSGSGSGTSPAVVRGYSQGQTIEQQVGKLFSLTIDLSNVDLSSLTTDRVRLTIAGDGGNTPLPEAIMLWHKPRHKRDDWLNSIGTRVEATYNSNTRLARFNDLFINRQLPTNSELVVHVIDRHNNNPVTVGKQPLATKEGKYQLQVFYSEPAPESAVIEFNFTPAVPARRKGHWYVVERDGDVGGHVPAGSAFPSRRFPIPTPRIVGHVPNNKTYREDGKCYFALINIDDNVNADSFGNC